MAERQQVRENSNNEEDDESPEPETSRSRRRFKASNMSFVEMVDILKRADYDGKYGPHRNQNFRKAKIMTKVVRSLQRNFGLRRSKEQLRKCWSNLKLREQDQFRRIKRVLQKSNVDVVEEETHFNSASAQIPIGEIMVCNRELEKVKENINDVEKRLNIIDVLGRI
ncbi:hypothetical protein AB205_0077760 [Aquarana catesbeiana]|uniref:Uncharacterized protein n=1 Tax=Aquarana catesbeiana TaxID=8400 RepID=A0A2G9RQV8_AQUCT|nr:hypothetical protein AB205_0077760 [Aquarana catesbeiana]